MTLKCIFFFLHGSLLIIETCSEMGCFGNFEAMWCLAHWRVETLVKYCQRNIANCQIVPASFDSNSAKFGTGSQQRTLVWHSWYVPLGLRQ